MHLNFYYPPPIRKTVFTLPIISAEKNDLIKKFLGVSCQCIFTIFKATKTFLLNLEQRSLKVSF